MTIQQKSHGEFVQTFILEASDELGVSLSVEDHSVSMALARADATNNVFLQNQQAQLYLDARMDTAEDDALDSFVNQFSPSFTGRIQALQATQGPTAPTLLAAPAVAGFLRLASTTGILASQQLAITRGAFSAATSTTAVEPTTLLSVSVALGATVLTVVSTAGMSVGGTLLLTDGVYTATGVVQNVSSGTSVTISALAATLNHTFSSATTVVKLLGVVAVTTIVCAGGTSLSDLTTGSTVAATTLMQGQRFYRNNPDISTPLITAKSISQNGYRVQTKLDAIAYEVVPDATNPYYDGTVNAYRMPAFASDIYVTVQAVNAGIDQNVQANTLNFLPSPIAGIDGTNNLYPIVNGADKETNDALKTRFRNFIASQNSANKLAIQAAVESVSTDIQFSVIENVASDGVTLSRGNFVIIVADNTGTLTPALLAAVSAAVELVRPITITYNVIAPLVSTPVTVIKLSVDTLSGIYTVLGVQQAVQAAVFAYYYSLAAGVNWVFVDLLNIITTVPGVLDCLELTVDGNGFDRSSGTFAVVGTGIVNGAVGVLTQTRPPLTNINVS